MPEVLDVARVRLSNALCLFEEFVQATVRSADAATLRGLERRFAERLLIQPSYWSQIKAGSRQIGERLARQFERQCKKPVGWLDQQAPGARAGQAVQDTSPGDDRAHDTQPRDDDERFMVGLVLTYYRRHPARARHRLLDLLGEVLHAPGAGLPPEQAAQHLTSQQQTPLHASVGARSMTTRRAASAPSAAVTTGRSGTAQVGHPAPRPDVSRAEAAATRPALRDDEALWSKVQAGVAPLKRKP